MIIKYKKLACLIILVLFAFCISTQFAFALDTNSSDLTNSDQTSDLIQSNDLDYKISAGNAEIVQKDNNANDSVSSSKDFSIFVVSDNPGTNVLDSACRELLDEHDNLDNVKFIVRSGIQVKEMDESEFTALLAGCDVFIGEWVSTDVDAVLTSALNKDPSLSDKKMFFILEPPVGNLNSGSSSINLIKSSTLDYKRIFTSLDNNALISYFANTKRGTPYSSVMEVIESEGADFNPMFNKMVLYKDIHDKDNLKNQLLYVLNYFGFNVKYNEPVPDESKLYGIYRDKWYTLDEYKKEFFNPKNKRTIGLLESTMYISSQQLHPCYEIIEYLEGKGYNVIPVYAAGGTAEQLRVMVESFTSAGDDISGFIANSADYDVYVDAIVSVVAYGVGGENFTVTTKFFEELGVPVFRAVHSDYVSNEQWELGTTGLTTEKSDKWWHVTIAEAQGIIDATFIGGASSYVSNTTGARIVTYIPHTGNIELLCDRIDSWVDLQYMANENKALSIIYYNYPPGKQNIGSSYLDVITSIYNMLYALKDEGYDVGELPSNVSELEDLILKCGINVATWAPGELEKLANQSDVVLLPVEEYTSWFESLDPIVKIQVREGPIPYIGELAKRSVELKFTVTIGDTIDDWYNQIVSLLPENNSAKATSVLDNIVAALKNYTSTGLQEYYDLYLKYAEEFKLLDIQGLNGWGDAPGNVMVVNRNGTDYFVIPGLTFGNVFIAPEPQRGWESDIENLYHCTAVAPTHQYLAAYYYMQMNYPNAMIFTGRHATHEWLPGKEILLSSTDYGSVVVGEVPQLYVYITDGIGEALQAKRRGFAVLVSHLTSPMSYTHLYGNLTAAASLVEDYLNAKNSNSKDEIGKELADLIITNDYSMNLGLTKDDVSKLAYDSLVEKVDSFLKSTQSTIYPLGLHALGKYWDEEDLAGTVSVMLSFDFELGDNIGETNLFDVISRAYFKGKHYDNLSSFEREFVLNKSYDVCKALIYWDADTVYNTLINSNNNFDNEKLLACLNLAKKYINLINSSISAELEAIVSGLNGEYIPISEGGEIIGKPQIMPTGKNMFQDQSCELPSEEAYEYAKTLALLTLADLNDTTEKVIMGIWCVETARDDGALVSTVLYLLGMKPVWTDSPSAGYDEEDEDGVKIGKKIRTKPNHVLLEDLVRPEGWDKKRIDVTVITSGLFRDLYSSQALILDNAFRVALSRSYITLLQNISKMDNSKELKEALNYVMSSIGMNSAGRESLEDNYVAKHWLEDCQYYLSLGYNATYAGECAITRIFAPPNGDYGAGISKLVSMSWTWNDTSELADFYLGRMGNMYSKNYWGDTNPVVFLRALSDSDTIVTSRNTNQYGVLDNDDFFDYWGGLSMAVEHASGKTPKMNVLMYANKNNAYVSSLEEVMYQEIAARYDNPNWISGMMKEGYSGARYMSNKYVSNVWGWQVTRPSAVTDDLWYRIYDTYYNDKYNLGVKEWLQSGNNAYSLISMSGTMLTAVHEGYWAADKATISDIANTWAQATIKNGVACCDCSCGNIAMMEWAIQYVNPDILAQLLPKLYDATQNPVFLSNSYLPDNAEQSNEEASTTNPVKGSNSTSTTSTSSSSQNNQNLQNNQNSQGDAVSNVGENGEAGQVASGGAQAADVKKAIEINPLTAQSASEVGLSIIAVLGVLCLIGIIALGYFRNRDEEENIKDLDKLFDEKLM